MGRDLQEIKPLAEQIYRLAGELLRVIDMDEQARQKFIEDLKKRTRKNYLLSGRGGGRTQQRYYAKIGNQINQKGD